jgi:signal peptidase I
MTASSAVSPARIEPERQIAPRPIAPVNAISEKVRTNGSACFRVLGNSMFPWIRSGDFVFVRRSDFDAASVGHVILYERSNRLFVHRVLRRAKAPVNAAGSSMLVTKGDALDRADSPVSKSEFLGRITRIHRRQRHADLESLGSVLFGRFLAIVSRASFLAYAPLRLVRQALFG